MRYPLLDSIRGLAIISMILYHGMWDIVYIFGVKAQWFTSLPGFLWEQSICFTFILLSGFCQTLAKRPFKDGILISAAGILVTIVSLLFPVGVEIYYGILTFLGLAILITAILQKVLEKISPVILGVFSLILFILTYHVSRGTFGIGDFAVTLPEILYNNSLAPIFNLLGFPQYGFYSGDYFPLIPWFFLFLIGYSLGEWVKEKKEYGLLTYGMIPVLDFLGRHSLIIYLIHQPIIYGLLFLFFR